jgi:hypothetical protein
VPLNQTVSGFYCGGLQAARDGVYFGGARGRAIGMWNVIRKSVIGVSIVLASFGAAANAETDSPKPQQPPSPFMAAPGDTDANRVAKKCGFLAAMSGDSFKGSELDAAKAYVTSVFYICLVHAMPADWPDARATLKKGQESFSQAQALKPDLTTNPETLGPVFDKIRAPTPAH